MIMMFFQQNAAEKAVLDRFRAISMKAKLGILKKTVEILIIYSFNDLSQSSNSNMTMIQIFKMWMEDDSVEQISKLVTILIDSEQIHSANVLYNYLVYIFLHWIVISFLLIRFK